MSIISRKHLDEEFKEQLALPLQYDPYKWVNNYDVGKAGQSKTTLVFVTLFTNKPSSLMHTANIPSNHLATGLKHKYRIRRRLLY